MGKIIDRIREREKAEVCARCVASIEEHLQRRMKSIHIAQRVDAGKPDSDMTKKNKAIVSELMDILNEIRSPPPV